VIEPLYFRAYDANHAERVMGKTIVSSYAGEAGDAILEGWDVRPRLGEIRAPTLILVGRDDFVCPPSRRKSCTSASPTRVGGLRGERPLPARRGTEGLLRSGQGLATANLTGPIHRSA
jgi:hypothetical protein